MIIHSQQQCLETSSEAGVLGCLFVVGGSVEYDVMEESMKPVAHMQAMFLVSCPPGL